MNMLPPQAIIWETHISHLSNQDPRWQRIWSTFLKQCSIPEDAESFPGHRSQEGTPKGKLHHTAFEKCLQDPTPFGDTLKEYASRMGKAFRMNSLKKGEWRQTKGRYIRNMPEEEEIISDDLSAILGGQVTKGDNSYYPQKGYRAWQTNGLDTVGWRLYLVHNIGSSSFRYRHPTTGEVQTCIDTDGTLRLFRITPSQSMWHCVTSEGHRWTLGYHLSDHAAEVLRAHMRPIEPLLPPSPNGGELDASREGPSTPRAVALLFGSSNGTRRKAHSSAMEDRTEDGEGDGEETKTGETRQAWVRSGEWEPITGDETGDQEGGVFTDVRLNEPTAA